MAWEFLKLYPEKKLSFQDVLRALGQLGYNPVKKIAEEGDFTFKGEILEIFPVSFDSPVRIVWEWDEIEAIKIFNLSKPNICEDIDLLVVLPVSKKRRKNIKHKEEIPLSPLLKISPGDLVVHIDYGIGIYRGKKKFKVKRTAVSAGPLTDRDVFQYEEKDFLEIEYRDRNRIYVSVEKSHLIQKYVNFGGRKPKLSDLATNQWQAVLKRTKQGIRKYALEIVRTQALREILGGFAFKGNSQWQKEFYKTFPFEETPGQKQAWEKVETLMESKKPMDILICGDTGYGKTEVAMRAAFKAALDSKQAVFLVPTTILAQQHYLNFKRRLKDFPVRVEMLSRFNSLKEQTEIIAGIEKGLVDIIVGTHRVLSSDVRFKDLGLLIIDEEQRFGVVQKERIKKLKANIDVIHLTATPIPRTLYLGLSGIREIALIQTPPRQRLAVNSEKIYFNLRKITEIIIREKERGGQVFFIEPRIEGVFKITKDLKRALPENISLEYAYGRMPVHKLEEVIIRFINGDIDCLVSTNIVESGIDIPRANTIIINNAHMFGMADLHQLRGRVGRFTQQAYAYFVLPKNEVSLEALKRIDSIIKYSYLGAGFDLAKADLEMRGAGNILGTKQHGFIWAVGFDLYCRLLKTEIENIRALFPTCAGYR